MLFKLLVIIELNLILVASESGYSTEDHIFGEKELEVWRWNVEEFPHPQQQPRYCHRFVSSNICDPDDLLKKNQVDELDTAIRRVYNETNCICPDCTISTGGVIIGIALMKHIYLPYNEHSSMIIKEFGEELRKQWKLGVCGNEILIVLVTGDRLSYTSIGPGMSLYIQNSEVSRIFQENRAHFSVGNYYEGLSLMVQAYYDISRSLDAIPDSGEINVGLVVGVVVGVVLFVVLVVLTFCAMRRRTDATTTTFRKGSYEGDISLSWKKSKQYHPCKTQDQDATKTSTEVKGDDLTVNNNEFQINTDPQECAEDPQTSSTVNETTQLTNEEEPETCVKQAGNTKLLDIQC